MARIFQASARIQHQTITTAGATFSVPSTEDFTAVDGSGNRIWTTKDLSLSEFGVNEADKTLSIRIGNEVKQIDCWTNPIKLDITTTGTGTYSIAQIPITQKDANGNWALNLINFQIAVQTTQAGSSTVSPFNPLTYDYFLLDTGIINWKPSGGSYSFVSTGNYSASTLSVGEFSAYFNWNITTQDSISGSTASINIIQTGGSIRNATATIRWKKTIL